MLGEFFDWVTETFRDMDKTEADEFWASLTIEEKKEAIEVYKMYKCEVEECDPTWVPGVYVEKGGEDDGISGKV